MEDRILSIAATGFRCIGCANLQLSENHLATIIAGDSGAGKTTALDLLAFAGALVRGDVEGFLLQRGWEPESLARRGFSRRGRLFGLNVRGVAGGENFLWTVQCNAADGTCAAERLSVGDDQNFLFYDGHALCIQGKCTSVCFHCEGSIMGAMNRRSLPPVVRRVVDLLSGLRSFGSICPAFAARASYGVSDSIGFGGETLAGFLAGLKKEQKEALVEEMRNLLPWFEDYSVRGRRDGTKDLAVLERTEDGKVLEWPAAEAGASALRLLAIVSAAMFFKGIPLLDEVDIGLTSHTAMQLGAFLARLDRQAVCTVSGAGIADGIEGDSVWDCVRVAMRSDCGTLFAVVDVKMPSEEQISGALKRAPNPAWRFRRNAAWQNSLSSWNMRKKRRRRRQEKRSSR